MSSIKFDTNASAEEVRNMTMQWGYAPVPVANPEPAKKENETLAAIFRVLNPVFNFISMLAGAATAVAILAYIAWLTGILKTVA